MSGGLAPLRRAFSILRIAGKQLRKEPRKARLIVALVALPSTVLMLIGTVYASQNPTTAELVASELGQSQAWIQVAAPDGITVNQDPYTAMWMGSYEQAPEGAPNADVRSLLPEGARALTLDQGFAVVQTGNRAARLSAVVGEAWDPALTGKFDVVEGASPAGPGEVMLSPDAAARLNVGVGETVSVGRPAHEVKVVGILGGRVGFWPGSVYGLAADLEVPDWSTPTWYLPDTSITAAQQADFNSHGLLVFSREVTEGGRPSGPVGSGVTLATNAFANSGVSATLGIGAFEMLLLAGAGFVVSMRSNQRNLAMLAATGAPRGTLVGVGVASGAWLGLVGGLFGIPCGLLVARAWIWFVTRHGGTEGASSIWGFHIVPEYILGTLAFAVVVSALASLIPALAAARIDVVAALRGSQRPARPSRWPAIVGAALAAGSAVLFVWAARMYEHSWEIARSNGNHEAQTATNISVAALVVGLVGASFAAPLALRALARALSPLGLAARIAARDAARHVFRTVPVVAAIAITVAVSTLGAVTADHESRLYTDDLHAPYGDGQVLLDHWEGEAVAYADGQEVTEAIVSAVPDAQAVAVNLFEDQMDVAGPTMGVTLAMPEANICPEWLAGDGAMTDKEYSKDPRCGRSDTGGIFASGIAVGGVAQLEAILGRDATVAELAALQDGGAVVFGSLYLQDGTATFAMWDYGQEHYPDLESVPDRVVTVDAVAADSIGLSARGFSAIVSPEVAAGLGSTVVPDSVLVHRDGGLSQEQEDSIQSALFTVGDMYISVSRPPSDYALYYALMSLGAVLFIGGACTAIALGLARQEAAHDDATLASLGASPALTKQVAAWHAGIVVGLAGVVGGSLGTAVAWVTLRDVATGRLEAPWLLVALALVAVPALVASLAWMFTRAPKAVHYRLAA